MTISDKDFLLVKTIAWTGVLWIILLVLFFVALILKLFSLF